MKLRVKLGIAATFVLIAAAGMNLNAGAQDPINDVPAAFPSLTNYWHMNKGGYQDIVQGRTGQWAEVITATPRWLIVADEDGRQYPIASDRVRQFLIRWPSSTTTFTNASMIEVTGPDAGSNVIIAEHIDQYEGTARTLVTPTVNNFYNNYGFNYNYGYSQTMAPWNVAPMTTFQSTYFGMPFGYATPLPLHIVGVALANDPVRISGAGENWYTIQPSSNGMTVTQVTTGDNSFARRGDLVFLILDSMSPRSLDVSQMVLYKKIPIGAFRP
jgi:hypothetical protein